MMALQKSLMEQTDIVPVLKNFNVQIDDAGELVVMNPPTVEVKEKSSIVLDGPLQCLDTFTNVLIVKVRWR